MTKIEAFNDIKYYLKSHFINYSENIFAKLIKMTYRGYENCPNMALESAIFFHSDWMECRVYYTELGSYICKNSTTHRADLYRLLNYIHATVWPRVSDGSDGELYPPSWLYTPRIYITEIDDCYDITATTIIPYDFYEIAPLETADYMTACIPELMDKLSPAIFGVLSGIKTTEDAIAYVNSAVLNEE